MTWTWSPAPVLIAGPCALEDDEINLAIATVLAELQEQLGLRVLYKGSFDKANRSMPHGARGPGLERGLRALERVRRETGLPVLTDIHEPNQARPVSEVVDVLQIPAFLCRQTDLLEAAGETGRPVNVKKGQWMTPESMVGAVQKVRNGGSEAIAVTERGTFFGYGDLVVDMRSFARLRAATGTTVLFDATHATQQPGRGPGGSSGGNPNESEALMRAAAGAGVDGFYLETHPAPASAPSDGGSMLPLDRLGDAVATALRIRDAARERSTVGA